MIIAPPSRPKLTRIAKEQPHDVQATVGNSTITPIDTLTITPGGEEGVQLPAFFVDASAPDNSGAGTEADPFQTITKARDAMRSSGTTSRTYFRGGTHSVTSAISLNTNDVSTEWLAYPTEAPVFDRGNVESPIFSIAGADGITFDGIKFQNVSGTGNDAPGAIQLDGSTSNGLVENCTFDTCQVGVWRQSGTCNGWKVLTSSFENILWCGIAGLGGMDTWNVAGNTVNNIGTGTGGSDAFILAYDATDWLIEYNTVTNSNYIALCVMTDGVIVGNPSGAPKIGLPSDVRNVSCKFNVVSTFGTGADDGGGIYFVGRAGGLMASTISNNWVEVGGTTAEDRHSCVYLDDIASGFTVSNNVFVDSRIGPLQLNGGNNITFENNICLLVEGLSRASVSLQGFEDQVIFYNPRIPHDDPINMTDNLIQKNLMIPVNSSLTRISYTATTSRDVYIERRGDGFTEPTVRNNALGTGIGLDSEETSSTQFDSTINEATGTDGGFFDNYDPANKILELNVASPFFTEGGVHIPGVTNGGTFTWGSPDDNANSGYDRNNYV